MPDPAATPEALVASILKIHREGLAVAARLEAAKDRLIALGTGKYSDGEGHELTVVEGAAGRPASVPVTYELAAEEEAAARKLAGEKFGQLFDRKVVFSPCEAFPSVVVKLLTPAKAAHLVELCKVETPIKAVAPKSAYIKGLPKE